MFKTYWYLQLNAIIACSNIMWFCIYRYNNDWGKICIRDIHKRHPISHPYGQAMGCLLWQFWVKIDRVIMALHCISAISSSVTDSNHQQWSVNIVIQLQLNGNWTRSPVKWSKHQLFVPTPKYYQSWVSISAGCGSGHWLKSLIMWDIFDSTGSFVLV